MNPTTLQYQQMLARLRASASTYVANRWDSLGHYDEADVAPFVAQVVPIIGAAQRQAVALTDGYLARMTGRSPIGLDIATLTGAAVRAGTDPSTVYGRPFVNVWTALKNGELWATAVEAGRARALDTATMDVALSTRAAARAVGQEDDRIVGFQRVTDGDACEFCDLVSDQRYTTEDLMPLHNNCGCTVEPILSSERHRFTGNLANDLSIPVTRDGVTAAVRDHGELGPLLVNGDDHFTTEDDLAA